MHYFFLTGQDIKSEAEVFLSPEDINHAYRVLRLKTGDRVAVSDGLGRAWKARVTGADPKAVAVRIAEPLDPAESSLRINLYQSLVKGDKMDLIVRQAVELGVYSILPVISSRSIPQREKQQDQKRLLRWRSKVRSAAAQCRRAYLPRVGDVRKLLSVLPGIEGSISLVPWEGERTAPLDKVLSQPCPADRAVNLFIGPEGGFEQGEIEALIEAGAETVHLGPRILRSETAASVVIALIQAAWGDLSGKGDCS
jgi:16S rRNA (uracil1498-N3)-methyltransferase